MPANDKRKSDAYFEGGYWLLLWDFLYAAAVMVLLLETGISARMRDLADRVTGWGWIHSYLYWVQFVILLFLLEFPLSFYEEFFREHQYGLSNQSFTAWMRDNLVSLALAAIVGGFVVALIVALVQRFKSSWHWWAAGVSVIFVILTAMIVPVFMAPLFNTYTPLKDLTIKRQILSLARQNGIPAKDVYQVDASRQSKRVSANVSGLFGTERITLNDNLLNRCSPQAILSTMGHEMGHYVLHHIVNAVIFFSLVLILLFTVLRWLLDRALERRGDRWRIRGSGDVAALPLAALILLTLGFLFTPIGNTFTRTQEYEADIFGINTARQPDGEAEVDLLLGEYRKLDPGPLEEFVFFDHPSGRTRIYAAMRWKAENLCLFDESLACGIPPQSQNATTQDKHPRP